MTARRYSYRGSVARPRGQPLAATTIRSLQAIYDNGIGWRVIAKRCGAGRSTLYRAMCGGAVCVPTRDRIQRFVHSWKRADDAVHARHMRRWSPARRAAHEKRKAAA